jgi:mRNA interferase MazF
VVSGSELETLHGLIWVVMITSAENRRWSDDVSIEDFQAAGLSVPSVIRPAKIATLDARDAERIGKVATRVRAQVATQLTKQISPAVAR